MFCISRNLFISFRLYNLLADNYSKRAVTILCIYAISAVMSPLSFIIFIYLSLLFFLGNVANSLSICFPKLTFSIFSIDLFYSPLSLQFISILIFIFFLLLILALVGSFSGSLMCKIRFI